MMMKRQKRSVRTLVLAVLAGLLLPLLADAAPAAKPEKPPAGMGLYIVALHDPPPPVAPGKDGPPDIPVLGGRVLQRIMNRQLVYLPLGVSKKLRKNDAVAYVQRVWMGEPASEWDEQDDPADAAGRVAANAEEDDPAWFSGDYEYDGAGNITAVGKGAAYSYDSAGRLIKSMTAGVTETYGYDSFGNLTSRARGGFPVVTTAADPATNRLTGRLHDGVGNVTSDRNGLPYEYDAAGMITGMTATNGQRRRMLYTADDERIATSTSDLTRVRVRDFDGKVLREMTQYENQSWAEWGRDYIYANGALVAGEREGSIANRERHYHLDHLGSVRLITTANGLRVSSHEYLPFGTELTDRTQEYQTFGPLYIKADAMKFTSHERDVTGLDNVDDGDYLDYMHARYYDSGVGRFLSVDPVLGEPNRPQSWNRYAYALNNPLKYVDPTGMDETAAEWRCDGNGENCSYYYETTQAALEYTAGDTAADFARETATDVVMATGFPELLAGIINEDAGQFATGAGKQLLAAVPGGAASGATRTLGATGDVVFGGTTTLFRSVSQAEFEQLAADGVFKAGRGTMEGKWFAESVEHAAQWGQQLGNPRIVSATVPTRTANSFMRLQRLDGIGPARWAELHQLTQAIIRTIR